MKSSIIGANSLVIAPRPGCHVERAPSLVFTRVDLAVRRRTLRLKNAPPRGESLPSGDDEVTKEKVSMYVCFLFFFVLPRRFSVTHMVVT